MVLRWLVLLERIGQRHRVLMTLVVAGCRSNIASSICPRTSMNSAVTPSLGLRPKMAKEVWTFMKTNGLQMDKVSFGCMLGALTRGGCLKEAVDLLHLLYKRKEANVMMYNTMLNGCMHAKSKMYAVQCVQLMEAQGVAKDELSYVELIKLLGMRGDLAATKKWWKELNQNFVPSLSTRSPYIISLSRMNALTEAYQEFQNMLSDLGLESASQQILTRMMPLVRLSGHVVLDFCVGSAEAPDSLGRLFHQSGSSTVYHVIN